MLQIALMCEVGLKTGVIDTPHPGYQKISFDGPYPVRRFPVLRHIQIHSDKSPGIFARAWRFLMFVTFVRALVLRSRPKVIITYDPNGMVAVGHLPSIAARHTKLIWHFHELFSRRAGGVLSRYSVDFAYRRAAMPDLVSFPDKGRAEIFRRRAKLTHQPVEIVNCPRKLHTKPDNHLNTLLSKYGLAGKRVVYFQGWIGPTRCLETIIQSIGWWPEDTILVMVGPVIELYRNELSCIAAQLGVLDRILFVDPVPYQEVLHLAVGATVGCSLVADVAKDPNWVHSAGAINKRFEYMSVGLPQIANKGERMQDIIERPRCGLLVEATNPEAVGRAINSLLHNESLRVQMSCNARQLHLETFHYERQFEPVLNRIIQWSTQTCG